jgi:hypothetical protein
MKKAIALALCGALWAAAAAAEVTKGEWTGYLTDTHCGKHGATKDHTAGCIEKCIKGGSRPQIRVEGDGKLYDLAAFDSKVKGLVGQRVTLKGTLDKEKNTITVESAAAAPEKR